MTKRSMAELLRASPVRLAPMAGLTNLPFRQIAVRCGSGFTTNEEIDADALVRESATAVGMTKHDRSLGVVAMQLLGNSAETLVPAAAMLVEAGADIIDINMGCPVAKIVRRGKGAALMRDVVATADILSALRRELTDVPLTIKIRSGWDEGTQNAVEVARMAQDVGVDAITVHPRSRDQQFSGRAPWDVIRDVVQAVDIPVTGNGDVLSLDDAARMIAETGCAGVMIGRGALGRPWIFDEHYAELDPQERATYEAAIVSAHLDAIEEHFIPHHALIQAKKHVSRYASRWHGAHASREQIFACATIEEVREVYHLGRVGAVRAPRSGHEVATVDLGDLAEIDRR